MPKIFVFFLSDFQSGGTEWFALRLARGMMRHGIKPVFLVVKPEGDLLSLIDPEIEIVSLSGTGYTFFKTLKTLPSILRFLKERKPDAFFGGLTILNIVAAIAIKLAHVPTRLIVIEHMRLNEPVFSLWQKIKQTIKILFVRFSYIAADHIVAVSTTAKNDLIHLAKIDPARIVIISNPIIPEDFEALASQPPSHIWLKKERQNSVIIGIGRLLPNKDFSNLLHAFANVLKNKKAKLIIFGEGKDRLNLENLIKQLNLSDHVSLAGQINNVFSALRNADLFVLPSRSEAFGNVVVEALACGTPIISTDCGGPREILENGKYGTLVPSSTPHLLAETICAMLEAPPQNTKERIARGKSFNIETATQAYLSLTTSQKHT